jgi:hypothetical protein
MNIPQPVAVEEKKEAKSEVTYLPINKYAWDQEGKNVKYISSTFSQMKEFILAWMRSEQLRIKWSNFMLEKIL